MTLYLDASVVTPTLVDEPASAPVATYLRTATEALILSDLAAAETASAISRLVRMNFLSADLAAERLGQFDAWRVSTTSTLDFQPSDFRLAEVFVRRFDLGLRAPDALHAAICRRGGHRLVTLDKRLAAAAEALGVDVECPG